jgi:hypothetical protein
MWFFASPVKDILSNEVPEMPGTTCFSFLGWRQKWDGRINSTRQVQCSVMLTVK